MSVEIDGVNNIIKADTISEVTSANGVTIDGLTIKDGNIIGDVALAGTTPTFTIGDGGAEDAALIFDGNAQNFYIGLDDSADDLLIGLGSTVGTTPAIAIDENNLVTLPDGHMVIASTAAGDNLTLKSTNAGAEAGPQLVLHRDSASPANNDVIGRMRFEGEDNESNKTVYAQLTSQIIDKGSSGGEDSTFQMEVFNNGALRDIMSVKGATNGLAEVVFNESSQDVNFRIESDGNEYMFFVNAGGNAIGIGTSSPADMLDIKGNSPVISFIEEDQSNKNYKIGSFGSSFSVYDATAGAFRYTIDTEGNHVFNDGGADCNFKIESDGQARLFFVDGGNNEVQVSNVGTFYDTDRVFSVRQSQNNAGAVHISNAATDNAHAGMMYMSLNVDESTSAGFQLLADSNDNQIFFRGDGNGFFDGAADAGNADFAEYFESTDGSVLAIGKTVVLDNGKVRVSTDSDSAADIVGVVRHRKTVGVVGNSAWNKWKGKYKVDDYGVPLTENYSVTKWTETFTEDVKDYKITYNGKITTFDKEKGDKMEHNYMTDKIPSEVTVPSDATVVDVDADGVKLKRKILNDNYDASKEYVSREFRDEWNLIGLTGQVTMTKGQKTGDRWIKMRDISDTVEEWLVR